MSGRTEFHIQAAVATCRTCGAGWTGYDEMVAAIGHAFETGHRLDMQTASTFIFNPGAPVAEPAQEEQADG